MEALLLLVVVVVHQEAEQPLAKLQKAAVLVVVVVHGQGITQERRELLGKETEGETLSMEVLLREAAEGLIQQV